MNRNFKVKVQEEQGGEIRKTTILFDFEDEVGLQAIIEGILGKNNVALVSKILNEMRKSILLKIMIDNG